VFLRVTAKECVRVIEKLMPKALIRKNHIIKRPLGAYPLAEPKPQRVLE